MYRHVRLFEEQVAGWGLALSASQVDKLASYARLLSGYSEANVVGERDEEALLLNHILDSLSCLLASEVRRGGALIDVGSGGGLPGIPLAVALPESEVSLLEATGKKARFLGVAVQRLGLENVEIVNERAEDEGRGDRRGRYDVATSRAVASLSVVVEYCLPLLRVGGITLAMKAGLSEEELEDGKAAAKELGGRIGEVLPVPTVAELPVRQRNLVIVEKVAETPRRYPRRPGLARQRPLGAR